MMDGRWEGSLLGIDRVCGWESAMMSWESMTPATSWGISHGGGLGPGVRSKKDHTVGTVRPNSRSRIICFDRRIDSIASHPIPYAKHKAQCSTYNNDNNNDNKKKQSLAWAPLKNASSCSEN